MKKLVLAATLIALCFTTFVVAQDGENHGPQGPPDEIKALGHLVGSWDIKSMLRMTPEGDFAPFDGVGEMAYIAGGACMQMTFVADMQGMPFLGAGHLTFNRETGLWMDTWTDNMGGSMSVYTGKKEGNTMVLHGEDSMGGGAMMLTRVTTVYDSDTTLTWMLEHSVNKGETWDVYMTSKYTRK